MIEQPRITRQLALSFCKNLNRTFFFVPLFDNQPRRSAQSVPAHAFTTRPAAVVWRIGKTSWAGGIEPPAHMRLLPRGEVWGFTGYLFNAAMTDAGLQYTGNHHALDQRLVKTTLSTL